MIYSQKCEACMVKIHFFKLSEVRQLHKEGKLAPIVMPAIEHSLKLLEEDLQEF